MTTQPTLSLADFLIARIAEDEAMAKALQGQWSGWDGRWYVCDDGHLEQPIGEWEPGEDRLPNHHNNWHLALDPARVLADCEARRRIVEHYQQCCNAAADPAWSENRTARERSSSWVIALEPVLRALALPYAGHEQYDKAWRP